MTSTVGQFAVPQPTPATPDQEKQNWNYLQRLVNSWLTWTPWSTTWNGTIGNGAILARYVVIGKTCLFRIGLGGGDTTDYPGVQWTFSMPFQAASDPQLVAVGLAYAQIATGIATVSFAETPVAGEIATYGAASMNVVVLSTGAYVALTGQASPLVLSGLYEIS